MTPTHQDHDHRWSCQDAVVNSSTPNRTVRRLAGYTSAHPLTRTRAACWYVAHQLHGSAAAATGLNPAGDAGDTSHNISVRGTSTGRVGQNDRGRNRRGALTKWWSYASRKNVVFTARRYASAVCAVVLYPSVCLSVTSRYCIVQRTETSISCR